MDRIHIGTAGWNIPSQHAAEFPGAGSHLARYGARLPAVEINSSFYRPHRPATYARWAATVSVEKKGRPAPAPKMTTRPFSRWRMARRGT